MIRSLLLASVLMHGFAGAQEVTRAATERLARQVRNELVTLPYYGVFDHLAFRIEGRTVTLLGAVTRPTLRSTAERVVKDLEAVERVVNDIRVLPPSGTDDRLRIAIFRALYGHPSLNRYAMQAVPPIHIIVENGRATLEGVVATQAEKNIANVQANQVAGVFEVTNNLTVEASGENQ